MDLDEAKSQIKGMLDIATGDSDAVFRSLRNAQRAGRRFDGYSDTDDDDYAQLRLALADLTGNAAYRS